uniref:Uncharacterized protein n=1 Tax=Avena sativa TaxID=4498 RepID=A0ACD5TPA9_AVESA
MDGNAALWLKAYRHRHEISSWPALITAVEEKFGSDDHIKFLKQFLSLKQRGTVEEYHVEFEKLSYLISMQNPHYDEQFFVAHFIKGLKADIRTAVEVQVPGTVERAILLAIVQQEVLAGTKSWALRATGYNKHEPAVPKTDWAKPAVKLGSGDLWKDRQLRNFRRANGLCFKCGEKFDPTHQCGKKAPMEIHAAETVECPELLSDEVLNMIEQNDIAQAAQLSLSIHAMAGTEGAKTLRLRALIGNQILLILVDSGSSSFINTHMIDRIKCQVQDTEPIPVKIADGSFMQCNKFVPSLSWWCQGQTFTTDMKILDLGAYDAILGMDWLELHSPMVTDWKNHSLAFQYNNSFITLKGVLAPATNSIREFPVEQLVKWYKGNEVWAMAVVQAESDHEVAHIPPEVQTLLQGFQDVFAVLLSYHQKGNMIMLFLSKRMLHLLMLDHIATHLHTRMR